MRDRVREWLAGVPRAAWVPVAGVAAGLVVVGLVWLSGRGCEIARDSSSCGPLGVPLLMLAIAAAILAAHQLLRRAGLPRAGLTAFLGVCFMAVVVLALLSGRLSSAWTVLVVPAVSAVTFVMARLVGDRVG